MEKDLMTLELAAPGREFVIPYIARALQGSGVALASGGSPAAMAVMLSGTEVYAARRGEALDETSPVDTAHPLARAEQDFARRCADSAMPAFILRCANTVGTGMTGYMQQLARSIYRGTFFHFAGNEARLSTVHATQLADMVRELATAPREKFAGAILKPLNVTDSCDHTLRDLADALAFRMDTKHISTLSTAGQKWLGRLIYGSDRHARYTSTLTFSSALAQELFDTPTTDTVHYLRTHTYDQDSL